MLIFALKTKGGNKKANYRKTNKNRRLFHQSAMIEQLNILQIDVHLYYEQVDKPEKIEVFRFYDKS